MDRTMLALLAAGAGGLYLLTRPKAGRLVLAQRTGSGSGQFRLVAENVERQSRAADMPHRTFFVDGGAEALRAVDPRARGDDFAKVASLMMTGHGSARKFFTLQRGLRHGPDALPRWVSDRTHTAMVAPQLTYDAVVSFLGCRAGANPTEGNWQTSSYGPGGEDSLAAHYRDALIDAGCPAGVVVIGRTTSGEAHGNPAVRIFPCRRDQRGRPGLSALDLKYGPGAWREEENRQRWRRTMQGKMAFMLALGRPVTAAA
jgi:hypothetical protein